ncbi:MAG: hypothetical protein EOP56_04395 [Sphingobacteriales bacterium]|nr:MAG: hypothetical protein EOP56_04395 [Sphingobacteriales bacterium]
MYTHGTDFVVAMENDKGYNSYYINRYLDDGKSFDSLKRMILHKEIRMKFILDYHLLNPKGRSRPIDTLYVGNSKVY